MAFIRYATKDAARRAEVRFMGGAAFFQIFGNIFAAVVGTGLGPGESEAIGVALGYLGFEANGAANDPPRGDYRVATGWRPRKLPRYDRATVGGQFAHQTAEAAGLLSAVVRAVERSQTAETLGETDATSERVGEADHFAARGASVLHHAATTGEALAEQTDEGAPTAEERAVWLSHAPIDEIFRNSRVQSIIRQSGGNDEVLLQEVVRLISTTQVGSVQTVLIELVVPAMRDLAERLGDWGPAPDPSPSPERGYRFF